MEVDFMQAKALEVALEWYLDQGVDEALADAADSKFARPGDAPVPLPARDESPGSAPGKTVAKKSVAASAVSEGTAPVAFLGRSEAASEAARLAAQASSLDELKTAIENFDGLAIKKTATNMVFCDGNPQSPVMLVGEAPGADEDRLGKPFVGVSGQLLDRILACIGLDRAETDPAKSLYISNILNWRPPGNRTPAPAEIEISLPFIERHIMLANPKILILCGGVSSKALLGSDDGVSRLRKTWHIYKPRTAELGYEGPGIPAIATYHPAYLLRTPSQKRAVWADMLTVAAKRRDLGLR